MLHEQKRYSILVAELENKTIGWCSVSPHRPGRKALEITAEISYYVDENFRRNGIVSLLIKNAIEISKQNGFKNLFAILLDINLQSIYILKKFGFEKWGHLPKVAKINNDFLGQFIFGKQIQ
jgi:phosphinothricin acetyltransferase